MKSTDQPTLILGTAMWGWTTAPDTAFALLDEWYRNGFREVDTATNYPIDKDPEHFRLAERLLQEWTQVHGVGDLKIMMKVGSVNNLHTPEHVLKKSFLLMMLDEYRHMFESNLDTLMVHWDNREDPGEIRETLEGLETASRAGLRTGLSGIRHPNVYEELNRELGLDLRIQIKHNLIWSDYGKYQPFHGKSRFIAYGINAGGRKLNPKSYSENSSLRARGGDTGTEPPVIGAIRRVADRANEEMERPPLTAFYQMGMIYAYHHPDMQGILLGPSSPDQLQENLDFYRHLKSGEYRDVYDKLAGLTGETGND